MEDDKKQPVLTKELIERCESVEAARDIIKVEIEYNKAKDELERTLLERNANMFMAKKAKMVTPEFEKLEQEIQNEMPEKLKQKYLDKAQEVFEKYHPKDAKQKTLEYKENDEEIYAKGFNQGYVLSKEEPELSDKLVENIRDISTPYTDGFKDGKVEHHRELLAERLKQRDSEKEKNPDFDKKKDKDFDRDI